MLPNFLIIGAARSGTTTIYNHLKDHPDVYLPANKRPEPHFFLKNAEYVQGLSYYEQRFFSARNNQKAVGEASTSYLFGPDVPRQVRKHLPEVKLLCILRNPIERAFSGYWHTVKGGLETLSFDEAILREAERKKELAGTALGEIAPFAYAERGLYHQQLSRWLTEFPRSQMKIVIFDDFVADSNTVLGEIALFLEVSPDCLPKRVVEMENKSAPAKMQMLPATRKRLIEEFEEDLDELSRLLQRDFSNWLKV
jgi:hypothetical protein